MFRADRLIKVEKCMKRPVCKFIELRVAGNGLVACHVFIDESEGYGCRVQRLVASERSGLEIVVVSVASSQPFQAAGLSLFFCYYNYFR